MEIEKHGKGLLNRPKLTMCCSVKKKIEKKNSLFERKVNVTVSEAQIFSGYKFSLLLPKGRNYRK